MSLSIITGDITKCNTTAIVNAANTSLLGGRCGRGDSPCGRHNECELLESCYQSCLELALKHDIHDIAFPSISTGIYRFPVTKAAEIAVRTINRYPQINVTMVCFDSGTRQVYEDAKAAYQAGN